MIDEAKVDTAYLIECLRKLVEFSVARDGDMGEWNAAPVRVAIKELERLRADNARLRAEVERLTPREMTTAEACDVLNERKHADRADWRVEDEHRIRAVGNSFYSLFPIEAIYIAQGLLRDAAASAGEGEDARGGRG